MKSHNLSGLVLAAACLSVAPAGAALSTEGDHRMHAHATGSFSISMTPSAAPQRAGRTTLGKVLLDKVYAGDLVATAKGEMLNAVTDTKGAAGYVAMEAITGALQGREGSFVAQHAGTMADGQQALTIEIVPHSGTGQLTGISGTLAIRIVNGQHFYDIDYSLPEP
ncbi:DUF3224 domain-containing protein [Janthinobacterium sp. LB2P49]|uniref:DUF3224 domain-containing protein n=1 Tax=Janthinobacterium sp. LB2P49 TaxID=3424198 RepID=UPI003F27005B